MLKILTIVGARPQFIKAAAVSRVILRKFRGKIREVILHTGQHYDDNMSDIFFRQLAKTRPAHNLNIGSGSHAAQTAGMMRGIESFIGKVSPHCVLVYGDTNSTLAGALTAAKMRVPVVHVEAGLRSFNKGMPEEINRIACDHVSTLLFTPTRRGIENLIREGFPEGAPPPYHADNPGIFLSGDVMYDSCLHFGPLARKTSRVIHSLGLNDRPFALATIHRDNNTDIPARLQALFRALHAITARWRMSVVMPLHPRTRKMMRKNLSPSLYNTLAKNPLMKIIPPLPYLDIIALESSASLVLTDSGGMQKEAFFFRKPCIILRPETEWTELVKNGNAIVAGASLKKILDAFSTLMNRRDYTYPPLYGDGRAAEFICGKILKHIPGKRRAVGS